MTNKIIPTDIEITRQIKLQPIIEIAKKIGISQDYVENYGKYKAKISLELYEKIKDKPNGKLILVTAINPTPAGEGKTTTTIGLGDALNKLGKKTIICLREPSMGPCFGMKGGATGGGYSQVVPMEDINLHFTGDIHAVELANNLLAALIDNHIHHGNILKIDPRKIVWTRVIDLNDRALRKTVIGLGGSMNSFPREDAVEITVASEIMALLCLSQSLHELKERLSKIIVAYTYDNNPVTVADLKAQGALTVLLKDAIKPNLVQTLEHNPAFVHGGPFANIAHGCNSLIATKLALKLANYVVTEAGFGADLGAEKFMNIKCRIGNIEPAAAVIVATIRALKYHGGVAISNLSEPNYEALEKGIDNLKKHIENIHCFGVPVVVAINKFSTDTEEEIAFVQDRCDHLGVKIIKAQHWAYGSDGALELAQEVVNAVENKKTSFKFLYEDNCTLWQKVCKVARFIYGAKDVLADKKLRDKFKKLDEKGFSKFPICMAKTQYSLSSDPGLRGRPQDFDLPLRDLKLCAGAGFVVVYAGEILTMPGLPKNPAAERLDIDENENIIGLS